MPVTRNCDQCGTSYTRPPSLAGRFCSKRCAYDARIKAELTTEYRILVRPEHPLAGVTGLVPEHRALLYDAIGPGTHTCYHCGAAVTWKVNGRTSRGVLVVDHLDRNSHNNTLTNLVVSCQRCNIMNSPRAIRDDELFVLDSKGKRRRAEVRQCQQCGSDFFWTSQMGSRGRCCSRSCARKLDHASR